MKVILKTHVAHLGRPGDIKDVSAGFARNYLLPQKMAMSATPSTLRWREKGKEKLEKLAQQRQTQDQQLAGKLEGVNLSFSRRPAPEGKIFGSVGKSDILKSLKSCGLSLEKQTLVLDNAIKSVGEHEVEVRLQSVSAKIKVTVVARE